MTDPPRDRPFRWQALFQRAAEPLFVLDRRRRVLFVNHAWEQLTGVRADRVRGLLCRRPRPVGPDDSLEDLLSHLLTPPSEAFRGQFVRVRRLFVSRAAREGQPSRPPHWWDIEFFPLRQSGPHEGHLFVGRILPQPPAATPAASPLPERIEGLRLKRTSQHTFDLLASPRPEMRKLEQQARLASQVRTPVLIVGEPGTGKTSLARIIHYQGAARERSFAALDCRRLPPAAIADVLLADRAGSLWTSLGALYLSEPGLLPRDLQLRLCEWLAISGDNPTGPRLIAGTASSPGGLLEELHWRLAALTLEVPPLRQRREELPRILERLLGEANTDDTRTVRGLTPAALEAVRAYRWPGNLTELRRTLASARAHTTQELIDLPDLPFALRQARLNEQEPTRPAPRNLPLEETLAEVERRLIRLALRRARGNRSRAAELLGIHRPRLARRMESLGLEEPGHESE